ncbi:CoA-transferase family III domain-containing protein [Diplogelasinospora grovesii]|uniref:CoA-transferase family III domain-containing protein n=1 Tax=Diplogelasinospora grovesii TaxID=303347 RepID=A0AAN6S888_9PEZI|nr:CoA-transferase family III domain-containing protein [Diplogelasinospora grovesii]
MAFPQPPLTGIKVLEFAGLAPGPFAGMMLADAGAEVLRIDRPSSATPPAADLLTRHKSSICVDLKNPSGVALVRELCRSADVLIDPFRPGVLEKLGLGPDTLCTLNPRLIYARMTGFRRDGKYSAMAGHDINYLAVSGVLSMLGRKGQKPTPPINILGDFAGGGAMLVHGILLALIARDKQGQTPTRPDTIQQQETNNISIEPILGKDLSMGGFGTGAILASTPGPTTTTTNISARDGSGGQVVEANMVDGASYLSTYPRFTLKTPVGSCPRGSNLLDSGCPFYDTYETRDGRYMAVGALEPQFYRELIRGLGLGHYSWADTIERHSRECWPEIRRVFEQTFKTKTRAEWEGIFDGTDACCTPVLGYGELEGGRQRGEGGDQRPAVTLRNTPLLAIGQEEQDGKGGGGDASRGQGPGVDGNGYMGSTLNPGEGGEETLKKWLGWAKGVEHSVHQGGLVLVEKEKSRL